MSAFLHLHREPTTLVFNRYEPPHNRSARTYMESIGAIQASSTNLLQFLSHSRTCRSRIHNLASAPPLTRMSEPATPLIYSSKTYTLSLLEKMITANALATAIHDGSNKP
ncbi:hypothetical protein DEO72_LG11g1469 [Vigna unguiculata]|uniref:Uncharacterized protein n=1 Tax=Vigna unguiculata TaxID=3917 RepID=A0A4D6NPK4_VIGUN|nr:hypothetical protein DEO72_LG11g1469 [Vigna unguiculata]